MELKTLQQQFYDVLTQENPENIQRLSTLIKAPNNLESKDSIIIYQNSIDAQLIKTLKAIYPVCLKLVGENFFNYTAGKYIKKYPSTSPDLGKYGKEFSAFLAAFEPIKQLPYLPDVARLEWSYHRVFHGKQESNLDITKLAKIPPEAWKKLIFDLPENHVLIESSYPIHRIWEVNQPEYEGDDTIHLDDNKIYIFLRRKDYQIYLELPNEQEWNLLQL
ncbi:MAG: DNA-binding domain-containing protein, partial [Crocosphaera sp.]